MGNDKRSHGMQDVGASRGGQRKFAKVFTTLGDAKPHHFAIDREAARDPIIRIVETVRFHRTKSLLGSPPQGRARFFHVAPNDHATTPGNKIHQAAESQLVGFEIRINVGMIVFERRDNQIIGMVVEKLWPAVPESSFILVAFQNKLFAAAKSVTLTEVLRDAAHKKIGLFSRRVRSEEHTSE